MYIVIYTIRMCSSNNFYSLLSITNFICHRLENAPFAAADVTRALITLPPSIVSLYKAGEVSQMRGFISHNLHIAHGLNLLAVGGGNQFWILMSVWCCWQLRHTLPTDYQQQQQPAKHLLVDVNARTRCSSTLTHTYTERDALTVNIHCQFAGWCWRRHPQREIAGNCFASGRNRLSLSDRTIDGDRELVGLLHIPAHWQNICRMSEVVSDGTPHTLEVGGQESCSLFHCKLRLVVVSEIIHNFPPRGSMSWHERHAACGMWHGSVVAKILSPQGLSVCLSAEANGIHSQPDNETRQEGV